MPDTYLLAKRRYGFLPQRTIALDVTWLQLTPMGRAAFLLDYVATLYARTEADLALIDRIGETPTAVFRTIDHPAVVARVTGIPQTDLRQYTLLFDTETGRRLELHLGHQGYVALATVVAGDAKYADRRRVARPS